MQHFPSIEEQQNFYLEELCPRADDLLRFCYSLCLNRVQAHKTVSLVFRHCVERLHDVINTKSVMLYMLKFAWENTPPASEESMNASHPVVSMMKNLTREERVSVIGLDIMGIGENNCCRITGWEKETLQQHACRGRFKILELQPPSSGV